MPQLLQDPRIQAKLKDTLFTKPPRKREKPPVRKIIKSKLYSEDNLSDSDLVHMRGHPEDLQWLKTHVRPRFWSKFVSVANSRKHRGAPDIEELISVPTMPEAVLSVLCAEAWYLDSDKEMQMIFYRYGVGEVRLSSTSMPSRMYATKQFSKNRSFCVEFTMHVHSLLL